MLFTFFSVALFVATTLRCVSAEFAISSNSISQCKTTRISWEPTSPPYNLIVAKAEDMCGDPLLDLGDFSTTNIEWLATIRNGTQVYLSVMDANEQEAWSSKITVGPGDLDEACFNVPSSVAPANGNASPGSPTGSSPPPPPASPTPTTPVDPLGAANAGSLSSSAITVRQASLPIVAIAGLAVVVALL